MNFISQSNFLIEEEKPKEKVAAVKVNLGGGLFGGDDSSSDDDDSSDEGSDSSWFMTSESNNVIYALYCSQTKHLFSLQYHNYCRFLSQF